MIVYAWADKNFRSQLLKPANAKSVLANGASISNPVVITENDYNKDYIPEPDEVVFVLPNNARTATLRRARLFSKRPNC